MRRAWITPKRLLVLACAAAVVCSFLPLATASAVGSHARHGVLLLITPVTDVLHGVSLALRGSATPSPALGDEAGLEQQLLRALQYIRQLEQENTALREQITRLEQTQGVQGGAGVRLIDARVTAAGGDATRPRLVINRGASGGVRAGYAVVYGAHLVGEVAPRPGSQTAEVALITARGRSLKVRIVPPEPGTPTRAIETWVEAAELGGGAAFVVELGRGEPVAEGDLVSLADDRWPPEARGYFVGQVASIDDRTDKPLLLKRVVVRPMVPLGQLRQVTVLAPGG